MRLGEIYCNCKKFYNVIEKDWEKAEYFKKNPESIFYSNFGDKVDERSVKMVLFPSIYKKANSILQNVECLKKELVESDEVFRKNQNEEISNEEMYNVLSKLVNKVQCIIQLCESVGIGENKLGIDIKMPETDNLTDLKQYIDDLEFVFTKCPFFQSDEESLKLKSVDSGSIWLIIGVAGAAAMGSMILNNIAAFADKCIVLRSHWVTLKQQEQELKKAEMEQNERDELLKSVKKVYQVFVNNAIKDLEELSGKKLQDGDEKGRVEQSFERLEKLIDKGLQIHASIDSSKEVKAVFEPLEMHYLSKKDVLEQIEEKQDE